MLGVRLDETSSIINGILIAGGVGTSLNQTIDMFYSFTTYHKQYLVINLLNSLITVTGRSFKAFYYIKLM